MLAIAAPVLAAPCELSCSTTFWKESGSSSSTCRVRGTQIKAKFSQSKFGPRTTKTCFFCP